VPRYPEDVKSKMKRRGPARQRDGRWEHQTLGEFLLEAVQVGANRRDPVRFERLKEQATFFRTDVRRRQVNAIHFG
jgi:hypothetical protein